MALSISNSDFRIKKGDRRSSLHNETKYNNINLNFIAWNLDRAKFQKFDIFSLTSV